MNTVRNNLSEDCTVTLIASIDDETEERAKRIFCSRTKRVQGGMQTDRPV